MDAATQPKLGPQVAAAMAWWRDAGVDLCYADEPAQWLAEASSAGNAITPVRPAPARPEPQADAPRPAVGGPRDQWPRTLTEFAPWWLTEPSLDNGTVQRRVAPRGPEGADLMIIVPYPEAGDDTAPEGPTLLSGPEGRLLDAVLAAMGINPEQVYRAAVLPRHMPLPDWPGLNAAGFGQVLRHHIELVAPARVIAFGQNVLPLLGHDPAQNTAVSQYLNHEGRTIPMLGAHELRGMLTRPKSKAAFWQRWLDWTGTAFA